MAVGPQDPKPADQRSHLRCVQRQQLGPIYQELFGRDVELLLLIVAEPVNLRLQHVKRFHVRLFLS